ncbi:MAG: YqiA/YcfP family alpha/beta fold hydrolase, partial [Myxococcota bacterium]
FKDRENVVQVGKTGWGSVGYKAGLYQSDNGEYMLSFAGTNSGSIKDLWTDAKGGLGLVPEQFRMAGRAASAVKEITGDNMIVTGHSLGGGLAAYSSLMTGAPSVTFNPMDMPNSLIDHAIKNAVPQSPYTGMSAKEAVAASHEPDSGNRQYVQQGEFLDGIQSLTQYPDFGEKTVLPRTWKEAAVPHPPAHWHGIDLLIPRLEKHLDQEIMNQEPLVAIEPTPEDPPTAEEATGEPTVGSHGSGSEWGIG